MNTNINKENVKLDGRVPLKTLSTNVFNKHGVVFKETLKSLPSKVTRCKSTQTESQYSDVCCGTSDNAAEEMIVALTGGPLNETYFENLAEQRREALEVTIEENELLYKQIEELNISIKEVTERAEEAESQLLTAKSKLLLGSPSPLLDISREEVEEINEILATEQEL